MALPLLAVPHPWPVACGQPGRSASGDRLLAGAKGYLHHGSGPPAGWLGLDHVAAKDSKSSRWTGTTVQVLFKPWLTVLFVTCQTKSISKFKVGVGGHYQRAGKNLGPILQSAHHRQGAPPSLARRVYWHSLPRATAP